jgi:hypothetical protein
MTDDNGRSELEASLRAAYQARTGQVNAADLRPAEALEEPYAHELISPDPGHGTRRRARWTAPLLAAAAVVAVATAGTVTAVRLSADHAAPASNSTPTPSAPPSAPPTTEDPSTPSTVPSTSTPAAVTSAPTKVSAVPLPQGPEQPRSSVPWNAVGSGWTLVTWSKDVRSTGPTTLYLLDPNGTRYRIADLPASFEASPGIWSPDGKRLLGTNGNSPAELDLTTGVVRDFALPEGNVVSYTRPQGTALLESVIVGQSTVLERFGTDGRHQLSYPTKVAGAGALSSDAALYADDGSQLVVGAAHGLALLANDGQLIRALAAPRGYSGCQPSQWADAGALLASCEVSSANGGGALNVFRVPLSGAAPTQLTRGPNQQNPFGYNEIWSYSTGQLGLSPNGCGPRTLVRFGADGNGTRFPVPVPKGLPTSVVYIGHHGDDVVMLAHTSTCQSTPASLFVYNAATNASFVLITHGAAQGGVVDAIAWTTDQ